MIHPSFANLFDKIVNSEELSKNDATMIMSLPSYGISKYLYFMMFLILTN
jgi:hypothetical protein